MRMYGVASAIGLAAFAVLVISGQYYSEAVPEWAAQLSWVAIVLGGSAACGYFSPVRAWRWGALITGVQPLSALVLLPVLNAMGPAQNSTGGLVAVAIFTVLSLFVGPFAILASYSAGRAAAG